MEEKDPSLCLVYQKTGTCPMGNKCTNVHKDAAIPKSIVLHHIFPDIDLFQKLLPTKKIDISDSKRQCIIDSFFVDVACMLLQFGRLDDMVIAGNKNDTLCGNVLAIYHESDSAIAAQIALDGVYYAGRKIRVTLSPVQYIHFSLCHPFDGSECKKGDICPFIHPIEPSMSIYNEIFPKKIKSIPEALRSQKRRFIVHPMNVLYGLKCSQ